MPNVAEIIREHVTLDVKCVDRLYLNGYVPRLQSEGGVVAFLRQAGGRVVPSPAIFGEITTSFRARLRAWCDQGEIPWIEFRKGERKDEIVQKYRDRFAAPAGVVLVGVAQERAWAGYATKTRRGPWVHFAWHRKSVCVNHYYIYVIDREWGPAFIKVCGYAPYALKLCLKEERALRTETTFNDTHDFGVGRGLRNFSYLRTLGQHINTRLLETEQVAHDCGLAPAHLADLMLPTQTPEGEPAPALKFGQPRVTALLGALCTFACTPEGLTNGRLRPVVAQLLGGAVPAYTARQMGYDLRRFARKGLVRRVPGKLCYTVTPFGRRVALFLTKVHARVLRPGLQALDERMTARVPPPLRCAFAALDAATDALVKEARLAA
jgi:hypothetical protein